MRCNEVRAALLERKLGPESATAFPALRLHLDNCAACAARASAERALSDALRELKLAPPPPVDVTARVLRGLPALRRPDTDEVTTRQLGWAAAAALACGAGLLVTLWRMLPALSGPATEIWTLATNLRHPLGSIGSAGFALISAAMRTAGRLLQSLSPLVGALQGLEPVGIAALACCTAVMAGTIVFVVGRDLRTRVLTEKGDTI